MNLYLFTLLGAQCAHNAVHNTIGLEQAQNEWWGHMQLSLQGGEVLPPEKYDAMPIFCMRLLIKRAWLSEAYTCIASSHMAYLSCITVAMKPNALL